ncbi:MAG: AAA family ATPase [Planctomycetaceae bacterium]|jgi:predicted ATPase|nr:AAA family ATPase [Planctomycetaceae bacterium]
MRFIKGIRIKNYRILRDVSLGSIYTPAMSTGSENSSIGEPLTPITVVIGRNGYGKSTLCDAFGFIVDCLKSDAEQACIARGGFDKIASEGSDRIIEFQIRYGNLLYTLCITADDYNVPFVYAETLSHISSEFGNRNTMNFFANNGEGKVVRPDSGSVSDIHLADRRRLVLSTLGNLTQFPDIVSFREFLDNWYLCYFSPDAARTTPLAGPQRHLSCSGDNLANVIQYWEREHEGRLADMLGRVLGKVLGLTRIETFQTEDGRLLLRFFERGLQKPFYASQMSDGTLKLIAYLLLLGDPQPPPLICFEEPENGLYHKLLGAFIDEIRHWSDARTGVQGSQFFITTHQPYLVDALTPKEVWILDKGSDAFATVRRANDDPIVRSMVEEGMPLGALWFSEYLDSE